MKNMYNRFSKNGNQQLFNNSLKSIVFFLAALLLLNSNTTNAQTIITSTSTETSVTSGAQSKTVQNLETAVQCMQGGTVNVASAKIQVFAYDGDYPTFAWDIDGVDISNVSVHYKGFIRLPVDASDPDVVLNTGAQNALVVYTNVYNQLKYCIFDLDASGTGFNTTSDYDIAMVAVGTNPNMAINDNDDIVITYQGDHYGSTNFTDPTIFLIGGYFHTSTIFSYATAVEITGFAANCYARPVLPTIGSPINTFDFYNPDVSIANCNNVNDDEITVVFEDHDPNVAGNQGTVSYSCTWHDLMYSTTPAQGGESNAIVKKTNVTGNTDVLIPYTAPSTPLHPRVASIPYSYHENTNYNWDCAVVVEETSGSKIKMRYEAPEFTPGYDGALDLGLIYNAVGSGPMTFEFSWPYSGACPLANGMYVTFSNMVLNTGLNGIIKQVSGVNVTTLPFTFDVSFSGSPGTESGFVYFDNTQGSTPVTIGNITSESITSNVCTINYTPTTGYTPNCVRAGNSVTISGFGSPNTFYNGTWPVSSSSPNSFSFPLTHANTGLTTATASLINTTTSPTAQYVYGGIAAPKTNDVVVVNNQHGSGYLTNTSSFLNTLPAITWSWGDGLADIAWACNASSKYFILADKINMTTGYDTYTGLPLSTSGTNISAMGTTNDALQVNISADDFTVAAVTTGNCDATKTDNDENYAYYDNTSHLVTYRTQSGSQVTRTKKQTNDVVVTDLNIYPNPANETISVNSKNGLKTIEVYDVLGRVVLAQSPLLITQSHLIDVSNLPNGTYLIRIQTVDETINKTIVVQH